MGRVITAPGVLTNVQGQIDHVTDMYNDIKDNNLKPLTITLDSMSNANGAYSHTTEDDRITEDMKPVTLEVGTPECFCAPVTVTTANGSATVACSDAHGSSTITVTFVKTSPVTGGEDYPPAVTSTEFDILADRIGSLEELSTTDQSSIVNAVNELVDADAAINSKIAPVLYTGFSIDTTQVSGATVDVYIIGFLCYIRITGMTFKTGASGTGVITGLPKTLMQNNFVSVANNKTNTAYLMSKGEVFYILTGETSMNVNITSETESYSHAGFTVYPIDPTWFS